MSQAVITKAFTEWKAQQAVNNQPVTLDEFVFAFIPGLDVDKPISNTETLPAANKIVHRQTVSKSGVVNGSSVVYSVPLGADVGDFDFNWIGLINKASGTLAMIIHAPTQRKIKNASGQQGNVLVRSMLMEYSGAQAATQITTPAETWQIDFTARLAAMDERQRLENIDLYGAAAFFGTGYLVAKSGTQFYVTKGAGYVAGLRAELAANQNITVSAKPVKVWLDVAWSGTLTSEWKVASKITVAASLVDYVESGVQHHVFALASIDASGNITDLRPAGGLTDQALKAHEKSRNHPDATTKEKGFTQLSSETGSDSETLAATPKAVKAVKDELDQVKKGLGTAAGKDVQTSKDDVTAGRVLVNGSAIAIRSVRALAGGAGNDVSDANNLPGNSTSFIYSSAENSPGITGSLLDFAGLNNSYNIQIAASYSGGSKIKFRTYNGDAAKVWNAWCDIYHTGNKPTPADIAAVAKAGDAMSGTLIQDSVTQGAYNYTALSTGKTGGKNYLRKFRGGSGDVIWHETVQGSVYRLASGNTDVQEELSIGTTTGVQARGNIASLGAIIAGNGQTFSFSSSNTSALAGGINLWGNASRPTVIEFRDTAGYHFYSQRNTGGAITFSFNGVASFPGIALGDYGNFDARYYTKAQSDAGYMPRTGAYTKDESNARYLTDTRLGARNYRLMTKSTMFEIAGNIITGLQIEGEVDGNGDYIVMRPLQKMLNGTWYTVAQV